MKKVVGSTVVVVIAVVAMIAALPLGVGTPRAMGVGSDFTMPLIGGMAFAVVLAALLEILKALKVIDETHTRWVSLGAGIVWMALYLVLGEFPQYEGVATVILRMIMLFAELPIFTFASYKAIVQPVTRKQFNRYDVSS
jgi:hypothetical protein